jgi:hypothetical protein
MMAAKLLATTSKVFALGPMKFELVEFTGTVTLADGSGTQTGITDADTFDSKLVSPLHIFPQVDVDGVDGSTTTISGKTVTFVNSGQSNITARFLIFGY